MKKILSILLIMLLSMTACSRIQTADDSSSLKIVTTFFPITDLVERITNETPTQLLLNGSGNAHNWEPTPQDLILLEEADVFVYNGAGMEEWVDDVLASLTNADLIVIEASQDVIKLEGHKHHHDHDHDEEDHDDSDFRVDPHTWSSPKTVKTQLLTISQKLQAAYPELAETFKANTETHAGNFDEVDSEYQATLSKLVNPVLVVQHEAYGYLAHDYNLEQIGIEGIVPTSEPDPARMAEIIELVKARNVKTIFFEENVSDRVAQTLAQETGVDTAVLSTLEVPNEEGDNLISMMRKNLESLREGLE